LTTERVGDKHRAPSKTGIQSTAEDHHADGGPIIRGTTLWFWKVNRTKVWKKGTLQFLYQFALNRKAGGGSEEGDIELFRLGEEKDLLSAVEQKTKGKRDKFPHIFGVGLNLHKKRSVLRGGTLLNC